jgi:hypothetical protein
MNEQSAFQPDEVVIEDISASSYERPFDPKRHHAFAALYIGLSIIGIFAISMGGLLTAAFLMLWRLESYKAEQAEQLVAKVAVPLITSVGTFESILFGPLLAFILGFYFKGSQDTR